jgi:hypothetical protein
MHGGPDWALFSSAQGVILTSAQSVEREISAQKQALFL